MVGEEGWIHGKVKCLSSLVLSRTITLSWGAKKKESIHQRIILSDEGLHVGDCVVVENHGIHWPHKAEIVNIDMKNNTALIRWETTQKRDLDVLRDLKKILIGGDVAKKTKTHRFL
jgi:hypothetical protein